jgi:hypothetical protein
MGMCLGSWPGWWCRGGLSRGDGRSVSTVSARGRRLGASCAGRGVLRRVGGVWTGMQWICCAGSGSCGRSGWAGIRRHGSKRAISAAGCKSVSNRPGRIGGNPDGGRLGIGRERTAPRVNAVTGKAFRGDRYEPATVAHCESVVRGFSDFHREAGTGPMVNPFPLSRQRGVGRADAHQPDGTVRRAPQRSVSTEVGDARAAVHPRRAVRRVVCAAGVSS